ncbi:hypothetical protein L2E82_03294 [Cichorium intybus]|uniref:Uncharacterized protein n=1 Tax=Cichorium intybus TaxID=13427 RepID=A0ACB9H4Z1_CICIN|nr:hypothetical protein L2E82_03294 [Cichorium intybus]
MANQAASFLRRRSIELNSVPLRSVTCRATVMDTSYTVSSPFRRVELCCGLSVNSGVDRCAVYDFDFGD